MADAFGLRSIDDTDRPLQVLLRQQRRLRCTVMEWQEETRNARLVKAQLVAVWQRRPHPFSLSRVVPVVGGGYAAGVGGEADIERRFPILLADQLADVELTSRTHLGGAGVAEV